MEKMEKKENRGDSFLYNESYDDGKGCIHIPVYMPHIKGHPDVDIDFDKMKVEEVIIKHQKVWNGRWKVASSEAGIEEYLFYY